MSPFVLAGLLACGLLASAILGPWMLRSAAPALVRVPRLAVALLGGGVVIWLGTLLALGPMLAWVVSGPAWLPDRAAMVCQRCLAAANPFSTTTSIDSAIPAVLLLALPTAVTLALGTAVARVFVQRMRRSAHAAEQMLTGAGKRNVLGHDVLVVDEERPFALAFPSRHGGIVLSSGALRSLEHDELAAVLAHEAAHLRQHHHLIMALAAGVSRFLRWVPLISAADDALPHYLEIAADNQARRRAGTPALVSALLKLGERAVPAQSGQTVGVLHAAGPERIRQLVLPKTGTAGALPTLAVVAHLAVLAVIGTAVHLPYALAALSGCV